MTCPLLWAAVKTEMLRRNGPVMKSVESVLRPEESLRWERLVKEVGLKQEVDVWLMLVEG